MSANYLDTEIQDFSPLKNEECITLEQYNTEIDEALSQVNEGAFLTNEEVKMKGIKSL